MIQSKKGLQIRMLPSLQLRCGRVKQRQRRIMSNFYKEAMNTGNYLQMTLLTSSTVFEKFSSNPCFFPNAFK